MNFIEYRPLGVVVGCFLLSSFSPIIFFLKTGNRCLSARVSSRVGEGSSVWGLTQTYLIVPLASSDLRGHLKVNTSSQSQAGNEETLEKPCLGFEPDLRSPTHPIVHLASTDLRKNEEKAQWRKVCLGFKPELRSPIHLIVHLASTDLRKREEKHTGEKSV